MKELILTLLIYSAIIVSCATGSKEVNKSFSGNPVIPGWYADPEGIIIEDEYWIFPTWSDHYGASVTGVAFSAQQLKMRENAINKQYLKQTFLDAFSSPDLLDWERHHRVLDVEGVEWAAYSLWAPSIVESNGRFYLFFSANDIQGDDQTGGIGLAVADRPEGPYKDALGKPLIGKFHNGAQPIDQHVFRDDDGQYYMYYGGWRHCNVVKLRDDLLALEPFEDGEIFKELTPANYVEGPFMLKRNGIYYLMWSEGGWGGPNYSVAYAMGESPAGPFERIGKILEQDSAIATGAGHHSVIRVQGTDEHYIIYHRRPLDTENPHHRVVCIDELDFDEEGFIKPVKITFEGVKRRPIREE